MRGALISIFWLLILCQAASGQDVTMRFPELTAETLSGEKITFPDDVNAQVNILILVFEQNSQELVDTWAKIILDEYEPQADISYYEIPMISYWWKPIGWQIDNWMREGIPKDYHDNTATFYGNRSPYFDTLEMNDKSSCYLFLLDKEGNIFFRTEGPRTPQKEATFRQAIANHLPRAK